MSDKTPSHKPGASTLKKWEKDKGEKRAKDVSLKEAQFSTINARLNALEKEVKQLKDELTKRKGDKDGPNENIRKSGGGKS